MAPTRPFGVLVNVGFRPARGASKIDGASGKAAKAA